MFKYMILKGGEIVQTTNGIIYWVEISDIETRINQANEFEDQGEYRKAIDLMIEAIKLSYHVVASNQVNSSIYCYSKPPINPIRGSGSETSDFKKERLWAFWGVRKKAIRGLGRMIRVARENGSNEEKGIRFLDALMSLKSDSLTGSEIAKSWLSLADAQSVRLVDKAHIRYSILDERIGLGNDMAVKALENPDIEEIYIPIEVIKSFWVFVAQKFRENKYPEVVEFLNRMAQSQTDEKDNINTAKDLLAGKNVKIISYGGGEALGIIK